MDGITHACADLLRKCDEGSDTDSDILEKEFSKINPKASRKWLIRDASYNLPRKPPCSTMKETYPPPVEAEIRTRIGKRRSNVIRKYVDEISLQLIEEKKEPPPTEKYCTTYDMTYYIEGFKPVDKMYGNTPELYEKYPLYNSAPMSYWQSLYESRNGQPGYAALPDVKNPFKRRSTISKPLNEVLDDVKY